MSRSTLKTEPTIPLTRELTTGEIAELFSWYGTHTDLDQSVRFFREYLEHHHCEFTEEGIRSFLRYSPTVGYVCRIIMRGAKIPPASQRWVDHKLTEFKSFQPPVIFVDSDRPKEVKPKLSVQDHIKQQVTRCIGELESSVDSLILSNFTESMPPMAILRKHLIKGPQAQQIINWFKKMRDEFRLAHSSSDPEVREMYSNFSKSELNKLANYCDQIMSDGLVLVKESLDKKSPRQKRKRLPEQIVKSVQYQQSDEELKLTSVEPTQMVGAMAAWTYHCPTRTLTLHVADDASGLTFKGTTVMNASATQSVSKKLRKPADTLKEVLSGSKTIIKKLMGELTTKPTAYKNRMNKDTIIVRVHK